ncbi:MAG: tetratricopeptide repeat protein [Hyphomicrobiales bacterium]|nr:tetratricopeptide repeat protein [Hyphomicrobiales bacterium]
MIPGLSTFKRLAGRVLPARLRPMPSGPAQDLFEEGTAKLEDGDYREAEILFRRCIGMDGKHAAAMNDLALTLNHLQRPDEALQYYHRAVATDSRMVGAQHNAALLLQDMGRLDEAEEAFRRAIKMNGKHAAAICDLAMLLWRRDRHDEAVDAFQQCVEADPTYARAWDRLAEIWYGRGAFDRSNTACARGIQARFSQIRHFPAEDFATGAGPDPALARATLLDARGVFQGLGVTFFLAADLARRAVAAADGGAGDGADPGPALDLGVGPEADPADLARAFAEAGFTADGDGAPADGGALLLHHGNGTAVAVFPHLPDGADGCRRSLGDGPRRIDWHHAAFALREVDYLDTRFNVPDPAAAYLAECFGPDWQTPDPDFDPVVMAPSIVGGYPPAAEAAGFRHLHDRLTRRQFHAARRLFDFMREKAPQDPDLGSLLSLFGEAGE